MLACCALLACFASSESRSSRGVVLDGLFIGDTGLFIGDTVEVSYADDSEPLNESAATTIFLSCSSFILF